nr:peptide deformylase [Streptomyces sp. V4I23]
MLELLRRARHGAPTAQHQRGAPGHRWESRHHHLRGCRARLVAHEIDHLEGVVYTARMRPDAEPIPVSEYRGTGLIYSCQASAQVDRCGDIRYMRLPRDAAEAREVVAALYAAADRATSVHTFGKGIADDHFYRWARPAGRTRSRSLGRDVVCRPDGAGRQHDLGGRVQGLGTELAVRPAFRDVGQRDWLARCIAGSQHSVKLK